MFKSNKINNFFKYLILSIIPISFITGVNAEIKVVTTIQPLHSLISNVMGNKGKLDLILEGTASPHSFTLKPSHAKMLENADAIFWIDQDLEIFSQFLFESIVLPSEINFEEKKQQFAMAVERFTWEHAKNESHLLMQVLSILVVNYVEEVDLKKIFNSYKIKNILSISNIDNNILIMLNDNEVITLKVKKCFCLLEDIGKPIYPAIIPAYSKND